MANKISVVEDTSHNVLNKNIKRLLDFVKKFEVSRIVMKQEDGSIFIDMPHDKVAEYYLDTNNMPFVSSSGDFFRFEFKPETKLSNKSNFGKNVKKTHEKNIEINKEIVYGAYKKLESISDRDTIGDETIISINWDNNI